MSKSSSSSSGIGVIVLGVLFVGLKLGGVITWSWWWVLCPFWIPAAVLLLIFAGFMLASYVWAGS